MVRQFCARPTGLPYLLLSPSVVLARPALSAFLAPLRGELLNGVRLMELRRRKSTCAHVKFVERGKFSSRLALLRVVIFYLTSNAAELAHFISAIGELSNAVPVLHVELRRRKLCETFLRLSFKFSISKAVIFAYVPRC